MVKTPQVSQNCVWFWFCLAFVCTRTHMIDMPLKFLIYCFCYFFFPWNMLVEESGIFVLQSFNILDLAYCIWLMLFKVSLFVLGRTFHRWWCVPPIESHQEVYSVWLSFVKINQLVQNCQLDLWIIKIPTGFVACWPLLESIFPLIF